MSSDPFHHRTNTIRIRGQTYEVLDRLTQPRRGRWKVHHRDPAPNGTVYTAIILPNSAESDQLRKSIARIPRNQNSLPTLKAWEANSDTIALIISWCEGIDLAAYYKRFRKNGVSPIGVWEAVRRGKNLAFALSTLHSFAGVIHGDIKPSNLILPSEPGGIWLTDFGSGWQVEQTASREIGDGFNFVYASPEIVLHHPKVDARTDQFSAAVVLFEMLTGKLPYEGYGGKAGTPGFESIERAYQPPSKLMIGGETIPRGIMGQIDQIVTKALKLKPEERFETTKQFAHALDHVWQELKSKADHQTKHLSMSQTVLRWIRGTP
jgi:serine/threonine protein kinase